MLSLRWSSACSVGLAPDLANVYQALAILAARPLVQIEDNAIAP
jgi:hypothetical protein